MSKVIMIQGTSSSVGKSFIVSALCRIFLQDGFKTSPFKAQNMSLNSFVTRDGKEMGRAQVVQAQAARLEPDADMNPVLLKPTQDTKAQIIVQGKPIGNMDVQEYIKFKPRALKKILESFSRLKNKYEIIAIEGAGSPAEINLKKHDIVNMRIAKITKAPVILVGDIDKGGVFAALVGTLELLDKKERDRVKGFIINKFRGDKKLLEKGIDFLEKRTGKPVLGVVPFLKDIEIPEEDSVALETRDQKSKTKNQKNLIKIAVIKLPHISNFTDFDPLENEPDVTLSYIENAAGLNSAHAIIIPGTKNTIQDLLWLKKTGIAEKIISSSSSVIGICGGYQMLGETIYDPKGIESAQKKVKGLGLLPISTTLKMQKVLTQTKALDLSTNLKVEGYEIHHGKTIRLKPCKALFKVVGGGYLDGASSKDGRIWGTYLHGIFDNTLFRRNFLNGIRHKLGLKKLPIAQAGFNQDKEFDKLAALVRNNLDMKSLYKILNYES